MEGYGCEDKKKSKNLGCLITLALVGAAMIAFAAIPYFLPFSARYPQSEAKTNLGAIYTTQAWYFGEYGTYAGGPDCFDLLGWDPEGETKYTYWCGEDFIAPKKPGVYVRSCMNERPMTTRYAFTVCAAGNIDRDYGADTWSMRDSKNLRNDMNDVTNK